MKGSNVKNFIKLCLLGLLIGALGGVLSAAFVHLLSLVTSLRAAAPWLLMLLPLGGMATVLLYRAFGMENDGGTNKMVLALKNNGEIKPIAAPLIFVCTAITHLFGGSAGKEGAAIQMGAAAAWGVSDVLRLKDDERTAFIMCGMSAVFAGVFGTPLTAAFFILEFKFSRKIASFSLLPCVVSAMVSKIVSYSLGVAKESVPLTNSMPFSLATVGKVLILALGLCLVGMVMCFVFEKANHWAKKLISNPLLRIVLGAVMVVALTACVGDMRYNGSGMHMAIEAVEGKADWFDFVLKIVFTAVTLAAGFKGGEMVPTLCVGATFGCAFGTLLGLDASLAAAIGLVGLFCRATNSLLGAVLLGAELFGVSALPYFVVVCLVLWLLPSKPCLLENRFFQSPFLPKTKD